MNINGSNIINIIQDEKKKQQTKFIQYHMDTIEKKILLASKSGYDYIWYNINEHFKYDIEICSQKIIKILEANNFYVRLFEPHLLQIIW